LHCPDEEKYDLVNAISQAFISHRAEGRIFVGRRIADLGTINGIRIEFDDGSWGSRSCVLE
jgi:phosphomannomutase / phosphoglucomutase